MFVAATLVSARFVAAAVGFVASTFDFVVDDSTLLDSLAIPSAFLLPFGPATAATVPSATKSAPAPAPSATKSAPAPSTNVIVGFAVSCA